MPHNYDILNDQDFQRLSRKKDSICIVLTLATLMIYYGFIFLIAFGKDLMGVKITASINLGIPIGIGVIVVSWLLTGIYVRWANREYDRLAEKVRKKVIESTQQSSSGSPV